KARLAIALTGLGETNFMLNEKPSAKAQLEEALAIWRELKDRGRESATLSLLAGVYASLGEKRRAEEIYRQVLSEWRMVIPKL
ncbi:MAG: tetratricopeptide repeat protein, partial [Blastocatellia bacterium]